EPARLPLSLGETRLVGRHALARHRTRRYRRPGSVRARPQHPRARLLRHESEEPGWDAGLQRQQLLWKDVGDPPEPAGERELSMIVDRFDEVAAARVRTRARE